MITNKYPYTDFHELNLDWVLSKVQELESIVDELNERYSSLQKLVDEANAYTDRKVAGIDAKIAENTAAINSLTTELNTKVLQLTALITTGDDAIQSDLDTKYLRLLQMQTQQWEDMKDYIAQQTIDIKVRNFFTGQLVSIQSMFDYLARLHLTDAGTYTEVSGHNTYSHYVAQNRTYEYVITNSETFFDN